jgi:hypothetical protein
LYGKDRKIESDPRQDLGCGLFDDLTVVRIPSNLEMSCFPETNSCISGRNLVKDTSGILLAYSKNRKNKQMISQRAKEIDKTKNTLKVQQEKIQSAMKSTKAEIIFAAAAEY